MHTLLLVLYELVALLLSFIVLFKYESTLVYRFNGVRAYLSYLLVKFIRVVSNELPESLEGK